jgi:hypothetical protein
MSTYGPVLLALAALVVGCAGTPDAMPPVGERLTTGTLRGPLCKSQFCECKTTATAAGKPNPPLKRFELRAGPADNELWISIAGNELYKSKERATDCFYVDLPPGKHHVTLRAQGEAAVGANLDISELGVKGPWWYRTFSFECGSNVCDVPQLQDWRREVARLGTKHDPCGSTKILGVAYQTGRLPDGLHPVDLFVELDLEVYDFVPDQPSCRQ